MTAEGVQQAAKATKQLSLQEARMILGVEAEAPWEDVVKKFEHLFTANEKTGSFYLQSKIYRAKERLEQEYIEEGKPMPDVPPQQPPQQEQQNQ
jgi:mitochondrial import inner membrane translocase subunit TIM16